MNDAQTIYAYLVKLKRPFTTKEIAEHFGEEINVKRKISRLRRTGYIECVKQGPRNQGFIYQVKGDML